MYFHVYRQLGDGMKQIIMYFHELNDTSIDGYDFCLTAQLQRFSFLMGDVISF